MCLASGRRMVLERFVFCFLSSVFCFLVVFSFVVLLSSLPRGSDNDEGADDSDGIGDGENWLELKRTGSRNPKSR